MGKKKDSEEIQQSSALKFLWDWLISKYDFRRDIIKGRILYRKANSNDKFIELQDPELYSMSIEASFKGLKANGVTEIEKLLKSTYTQEINPVVEYLNEARKRKPVGTIKKLAACIKTNDDEAFERYLTKWLASSVANAVNKFGCQNHTCLVFTGGQFAGKTTFFKWICPPELKEYIYTGSIDLESKDSLWKLAEYWFINIEEQLKNLNRKDANKVKELFSLPDIKGRKPYGRLEAQGFRIANFMASTNDDDFLVDATGNRRFLCFKIESINDAEYNRIKIQDVWAEAYHYYLANPNSYYVTPEDVKELEVNNQQFLHITQEHEYVNLYFSKPKPEQDFHLMPASIIRDYLRVTTGNQILKDRSIGIALKQLGFEQVSYRFKGSTIPSKVWKVHFTNGSDLNILHPYHANKQNQYKP